MTYDGAGNDQICHILEFWMKEGMKAERAAVESGFNKWDKRTLTDGAIFI